MLSQANYDVLVQFRDKMPHQVDAFSARMCVLSEDNLLALRSRTYHKTDAGGVKFEYVEHTAVITVRGSDALSEFEADAQKQRENQAQQNKENRRNHAWEIALLFIGVAIDRLIVHAPQIIAFIKSQQEKKEPNRMRKRQTKF